MASCEDVARTLRVTRKTVHQWGRRLLVAGLPGLQRKKPPGRPPTRTKTQLQELAALLDEGPVQAGFASACGRSPMMQPVIHAGVGVYYHVFYIAQWLTALGCSYQNAAFVSDPLNDEKRREGVPPRGHPPVVKTSGQRKGDKGFGLLEYVTGRFWYQGQEGRFTSEAYIAFSLR
ncbi:MAG: hypothetical protein HYZ81_19265 [Nitrospinae bacterium]|nr:hypothetical protein [Nitrospinota bacterium]